MERDFERCIKKLLITYLICYKTQTRVLLNFNCTGLQRVCNNTILNMFQNTFPHRRCKTEVGGQTRTNLPCKDKRFSTNYLRKHRHRSNHPVTMTTSKFSAGEKWASFVYGHGHDRCHWLWVHRRPCALYGWTANHSWPHGFCSSLLVARPSWRAITPNYDVWVHREEVRTAKSSLHTPKTCQRYIQIADVCDC